MAVSNETLDKVNKYNKIVPSNYRLPSGKITPSGMPLQYTQQESLQNSMGTPPPSQTISPTNTEDSSNLLLQRNRLSNLIQAPQGVQPSQLQGLNPYAGIQIGGVSSAPFQQEQTALAKQGQIMSQATSEQGKSLKNLGQQQAEYYKGLQGQSQQNLETYKKATANFDKQIDDINAKYPLLNRQQVLDNMSTGDKILGALAIAFGGIGAGMTGRENTALGIINSKIDSTLQTNRENYARQLDVLNAKKSKSFSDFEMTRQNLNENATMQNNIFNSVKEQIDAQYKTASSPALRYQLEAAGAQVMQRMAQLNQQNALQNMQLQLQGKQWAAQMAMNPRAVDVGVDARGMPIKAVAASDKSAEVLREQLPVLEQKITVVRDMINYLNEAPDSAGKKQTFIGKNLEGMKQNIAKMYGLDPKEMPDITSKLSSDATDFYNQLLNQATKNKQDVINANIIK